MDSPSSPGRSEYAVRSLGVVVVGALVQFAVALFLFDAMVEGRGLAGQRASVSLVVVGTTLAAIGFLYVRTQYSSNDHVAWTIPRVLWGTPPLAAAIFLPITLPTWILEADHATLAQAAAPVVIAGWVSSLLVSLVSERLLRALASRYPPASELGALRTIAPPTLAGSHIRILTIASASAGLLALGAVLSHNDPLRLVASVPAWASVVGGLVLVGLAAAAGLSLGQSPGQDIVSIARRLDALGYDQQERMTSPIVATSFDEVGELLSSLEKLRAHLDQELAMYQEALDKTREADALKADFLSAVSHELRTPLNVVGGFAQLLLESESEPLSAAQAEDIRLIQAGGKQLLELINDILDVSMIESGELRLSFAPTDVAEVIAEVVRIHQPLVRDKPVELRSEIGPHLPIVVCDRRRLVQILTNLVSNAVKFTESGSILVRAAYDPRKGGVVIRCIDTGIGIEPQDLDAIFEEYRQVGSLKRRKKGTGLGLAIARSIAQHHGGSLTVESTVGQGSTFTLTLPRDPPTRPDSIGLTEEAARSMVRSGSLGPAPEVNS